ncbi:LacI family DNA-binding transcriptional regulator [Novosphingobium sp. SG707]|uniref:LacI family DNA-binding transcriptional regulator n=1 Tax=Novosphingobium sp. SG707 TaxID=2586996 RepID=UPI0014483995|nr:LacI family DNA-binding transcriptional regulator [Novosphingobium sp. SG707]NKJ01535.1 LacI family transcriptional regulator [Novosphingobium sp. SG707]
MSNRRPTLDDVARITGVSAKTVARTLNGEKGVGAETRERVMEAVLQLGYQMNVSARALASAKTLRICIVSNWMTAFFMSQIYRGAARACQERGYHLIIREFDPDKSDAIDSFRQQLQLAPVDGIFVTAPLSSNEQLLDMFDELGLRYVRHSPMGDFDRSDVVQADEMHGGALIARHLWEKGHRHFGLIMNIVGHVAATQRYQGFVEEIARLGGKPEKIRNVGYPVGSRAKEGDDPIGYNEAVELLAHKDRPTAIFAFNDEVAAGVLARGHATGFALPQDLAVAGYGNADFGRLTWPALTTVRQPNSEMAYQAVCWLTEPAPARVRAMTFPVELIPRASTGDA